MEVHMKAFSIGKFVLINPLNVSLINHTFFSSLLVCILTPTYVDIAIFISKILLMLPLNVSYVCKHLT